MAFPASVLTIFFDNAQVFASKYGFKLMKLSHGGPTTPQQLKCCNLRWPSLEKRNKLWTRLKNKHLLVSSICWSQAPIQSKLSLNFHLMMSRYDRPGFSDFSISPDWPITLESYIFGYDVIHNSSINSTSHFLSVSCIFLTLSVYISHLFFWNHSSFTFFTSVMSFLLARSPFYVCCSPSSTSIVVGLRRFIESSRVVPCPLIIYQRKGINSGGGTMIWCLCLLISGWNQT